MNIYCQSQPFQARYRKLFSWGFLWKDGCLQCFRQMHMEKRMKADGGWLPRAVRDSIMSSCTAADASRCTCCSMGLARCFEVYLLQPGVTLWDVITGHSLLAQAPTVVAASPGQQHGSPALGPASLGTSSSLLLSERCQAQRSSLISTTVSTESKSCPWRALGTTCSQASMPMAGKVPAD